VGSCEYGKLIILIMLKIFIALLLGFGYPASSTTSNSTNGCSTEDCECPEGNCDEPPGDDTGGETGLIPPKK